MVEKDASEGIETVTLQPRSPALESSTSWPGSSSNRNRFRTMIRQNSMKIGGMAEVMLPMDKRSVKTAHVQGEDVPDAIDLESQLPGKKVQIPVKKFPVFIVTISLIQVLFFIFGDEWTWLTFCYDPFRRHELWRYFTDMLVHKSLLHLLSNVIFQLILGLLLEIVHHWRRIGTIYMAGVVGGGLAVTVLDPLRYSLGASAGVYGLLLAHLATIVLNWNQMDRRFCRLFSLLFYVVVIDIGRTLYVKFYVETDSRVSHAGHFGGAVAGFIAAVFVLRNFEKLAWEKQFQKILAVISIILFLAVVIVNVAVPSHYQPSEFNFHYQETFVYYIITTIYGTPEWQQIEQACMEDPACAEFVNKNLKNLIETTTTESPFLL